MRNLIVAMAALAMCLPAQAASVWRVSNANNTLYIGGTLHLLSPDDYPLPEAYNTAYAHADTLVFETDMQTVGSAAFGAKMMRQNTYPSGQSLADDVSEDTLQLVKSYLSSYNLPPATMMQLKPAMLGLTLTMLEYQRQGLTSQGVDAFFHTLAMRDGKQLDWFETPDEQLSYISRMADGQEDEFVRYTLEDLGELGSIIGPMKSNWRSGDMQHLQTLILSDLSEQYPQVHDDLLVDRNVKWLPRIKQMMQTSETEFVLVGTLHLPGEQGVLKLLEQQGYTITQLD